jgi:dihydrofolate reductase
MLSIIVAMDLNNLIGRNNDMPWHYPEDLKYFHNVTVNKTVLMGYNTFLSITNRIKGVLPKRISYVLTSRKELPYGATPVHDLSSFLSVHKDEEVFVIGGRQVYESTINLVDYLYVTRINKVFEGDVFFPAFDWNQFQAIKKTVSGDLCFEVYKRVK